MSDVFGMIDIQHLKSCIASYPETPPRTSALEKRIQIGTGFHNKWYRSQREHMLGWMVVQECQARKNDKQPASVDARGMWNRLKCSPSMFWLAECAGVPDRALDEAERAAIDAARINPKDGDPHGKMIRAVLPWDMIADAIAANCVPALAEKAQEDARLAFERLTAMNAAYRPLRAWLG